MLLFSFSVKLLLTILIILISCSDTLGKFARFLHLSRMFHLLINCEKKKLNFSRQIELSRFDGVQFCVVDFGFVVSHCVRSANMRKWPSHIVPNVWPQANTFFSRSHPPTIYSVELSSWFFKCPVRYRDMSAHVASVHDVLAIVKIVKCTTINIHIDLYQIYLELNHLVGLVGCVVWWPVRCCPITQPINIQLIVVKYNSWLSFDSFQPTHMLVSVLMNWQQLRAADSTHTRATNLHHASAWT